MKGKIAEETRKARRKTIFKNLLSTNGRILDNDVFNVWKLKRIEVLRKTGKEPPMIRLY